MPTRRDIFVKNGIYHIFNRTIDKRAIFIDRGNAQPFLETLYYYRSKKADISFSHFKQLKSKIQAIKMATLAYKKHFIVDILSYCLMPTHFHLLIKQIGDEKNGIRIFMGNVINSFTRYFNRKMKRKGPLFLPRFQSRLIISDEQLLHVSRYQHLNPYSSRLIKKISNLGSYPWSSYVYFVEDKTSFLVNTRPILSLLGNDKKKYRAFVNDQADYQRSLEDLKYIGKWEFD